MLQSKIRMLLMPLPEDNTRYLFFTGKGGVGKTSLYCATGHALAEAGKRVLIVSTDPASNLDEVLETALGSRPVPVSGVSGLFALNIDPEVSARDYRKRMVAPYRGILPAAAIASMEEQFSGVRTVEIAAELSADDREPILLWGDRFARPSSWCSGRAFTCAHNWQPPAR